MTEMIRAQTHRERPGGPPDDFDGVWSNQEPAGLAQVSTGLYTEHLPVVGRTIVDIRETFANRLDIDPSASPVLDGELVTDESIRVEPGQRLAFVRHAGEKGASTALSPWQDVTPGITVSTGLSLEELPAAGPGGVADMTVGQIRRELAERLDIDPSARPVLDGEIVRDESTPVEPGQKLAFIRKAGEMGSGLLIDGTADLTPE